MAKFSDQFSKNFLKNEYLVPHLNNWFANADFPDEIPIIIRPNKEGDDAFHPSSALKCARVLYAQLEGEMPEQQTRMEMQKVFMIGRYYHELIQWICVEGLGFSTWEDIEKEHDYHFLTDAGNEYRIRGFLDIARCNIPGLDDPILVDIKTMMARQVALANPSAGLMEKYEAQVKIYLAFEGLDRSIILAVEKDNPHRFKEFVVDADDDFVDGVIERWEWITDERAAGRIPPHDCDDPGKCAAKDLY